MALKSKYIVGIVPGSVYQGEQAVIFSSFLNHIDVAAAIRMDVKGAGFVDASLVDIAIYGESISLNVKSRPEDLKAVRAALGLDPK